MCGQVCGARVKTRDTLKQHRKKLHNLTTPIPRTDLLGGFYYNHGYFCIIFVLGFSVADPDPPDQHVFGPPGSGSISHRYGSGSGYFYHHAKIVRKFLIPTIF